MIRQQHIVDLLKRRIERGAYLRSGLPTERDLAFEVGVARMTARKALGILASEGILVRSGRGRLIVAPGIHQQQRIAILIPSIMSRGIGAWIRDAARGATGLNAHIVPIYYEDYDDINLLNGFRDHCGVFLIPRADEMPEWVMRALQSHGKAVVLEADTSNVHIPCIDLFSTAAARRLLDYLYSLGHRSIDCVTMQGPAPAVCKRIETWEQWRAERGVEGRLIDLATVWRTDRLRALTTYFSDLARPATSLLSVSLRTAHLVLRAARNTGVTLGEEFSVCAVDGEQQSAFLTPSVTSLERPDTSGCLRDLIAWMLDSDAVWKGPYLVAAIEPELFIGETTGPVFLKTGK